MKSIIENIERIGNFTSSQISRLVSGERGLSESKKRDLLELENRHFAAEQGDAKVLTVKMEKTMNDLKFLRDNPQPTKAQLTYIEEKQIELRLGRSLKPEKHARASAWGHFMEYFVFEIVGTEYETVTNDSLMHPTIKGWSGTADLIVKGKKVSDLKSFEPKKFALYTDALLLGDINNLRENFAAEYWQLVSNAIINDTPNAEAITFIPYKSQLEEIRTFAAEYDGADQWKYKYIFDADDIELPYIPEGGYYKNLNKFEFVVPLEDIEKLTEIVLESIELRDKK